MLILLRENSHNNDISVFYDNKNRNYYKISYTNHGDQLIKNELNGIIFFNKFLPESKITFELFKKKNYRRLKINKIHGKIVNYNDSFYNNYKFFEKILSFYLTKWPNGKKQFAHGDLTLDNIFFHKNKFIIFDWEHFTASNELFFGYDLIYLLLSGIILPGEKKFDYNSKMKFKLLYKKLYDHDIKKKYLDDPFKSIDKIIANIFTNILLKSPNKFITISVRKNFKDKIINFMDKEVFNK